MCGPRDLSKTPTAYDNLAKGISQTIMGFMTQDTHSISPENGFDRDDDDLGEVIPHGTEGSPAHRATLTKACASAKAHSNKSQR